jgi:hypothetical protein
VRLGVLVVVRAGELQAPVAVRKHLVEVVAECPPELLRELAMFIEGIAERVGERCP